jgi:hypothetical protein
MPDSIRERVIAEVASRLDAIRDDPVYTTGSTLKSVQRYIHDVSGDTHLTNLYLESPTIIIRALSEECRRGDQVGAWTATLTLDIHYFVRGDDAGCSKINAALADIEKALMGDGFEGLAGFALLDSYSTQIVDPIEAAQEGDGIHVILGLTYTKVFGDPYTGAA